MARIASAVILVEFIKSVAAFVKTRTPPIHIGGYEVKLFNNSSGVAVAVPILPTTMPAA
jgi:hypothetical protein